MFVVSFVIHEGVHVWQCYDDPNTEFKGFTWTWTTFYVITEQNGKGKYDSATAETQAYSVQLVALAFMFAMYIMKKETDRQVAEDILQTIKKKYFQEIK